MFAKRDSAIASSCVFSLSHQATGGCYALPINPFQVSLVKPVAYPVLNYLVVGSEAGLSFPPL
jgi:hypothetical protein